MKQHLTAQKLVLTLALFALSICIFSFRQNDTTEQKTFRKESYQENDDTTRRKPNRSEDEFHLRDLDMTMRLLDEQMIKLNQQMKKIDFSKMQKELSAAAKIDHEKIAKQVQESLNKIDWKKMELEMKASADKIKNIDMVKMQEEMKKVSADLKRENFNVKIDAEKIRNDVNKAMANAKVSIEKAKVEIKLMKDFTNDLDKDGLIDKKKPFKIEVKSGELYINGQQQPKNVSDKYRKYYKKDNFSISSDGNDGAGVVI